MFLTKIKEQSALYRRTVCDAEVFKIKTYNCSKRVLFLLAVLSSSGLAYGKTFDSHACEAAGGQVTTSCPSDRMIGEVHGLHCKCFCCKAVPPIDCDAFAITVTEVCSTESELRGVLHYDAKALKATDLYFDLESNKSRFMVSIALPKPDGPVTSFRGTYPKWAKRPPTKSSGYRLTFGSVNQSCRLAGFEISKCR